MKKLLSKIVFLCSFISVMSLLSCSADDINKSMGVVGNLFKGFTISNEQLVAESRLSAKAMDKKHKVASYKNRYSRRLRKITRKLKHYDGLNLNYKVYISKNINAFAMPDGTVRVYSGLMDIMNDNELLAVIGHEIGHVKKQHSLNGYKKAYITKAVKEGLVAYGDGSIAALAGAYGDIGLKFVNAQFSQSDELEADSYGVGVLQSLGKNPCAAVTAQRKLQEQGGADNGLVSLFSSHPPSSKRVENANKAAGKICIN